MQTLEYNKETGKTTLNIYDDGFLLSETDITNKVTTLVPEKLYDEYGLGVGDELVIKKENLGKSTKFKV